jgi:ubiquinone/menaquinone biosynthesis C-methylase UbiE
VSSSLPVRMNCDRIAPYYETLEHLSFGTWLERSRFVFLKEVKLSRKAIICGGGDGRFLARLLQANSIVEVDFVELSSKMIALAEQRVAAMGQQFRERVRFHAADLRVFQPQTEGYDLIVTNFFLDCFSDSQLADVVARLSSWSLPHVRWIVSDFREAHTPIARFWTRSIVRALYAAFRLTTGLRVMRLPNYAAAIARERYVRRREENFLGGLVHSSLWELRRG